MHGHVNYNKKILEHFENPVNVGSLDSQDPNVGIGLVGSPACGDVLRFFILVDPQSKIIKDAKFQTFGCGSAIASSSVLTNNVIGKHIDMISNISNTDIAEELSLPPIKMHCSVLAETAIKRAVSNWYEKQNGHKKN